MKQAAIPSMVVLLIISSVFVCGFGSFANLLPPRQSKRWDRSHRWVRKGLAQQQNNFNFFLNDARQVGGCKKVFCLAKYSGYQRPGCFECFFLFTASTVFSFTSTPALHSVRSRLSAGASPKRPIPSPQFFFVHIFQIYWVYVKLKRLSASF